MRRPLQFDRRITLLCSAEGTRLYMHPLRATLAQTPEISLQKSEMLTTSSAPLCQLTSVCL